MIYEPRSYDAIVRDLLTTLTGGTVRESLAAPPEDILLVPQKLRDRPVRRVSHLEGTIRVGSGDQARDLAYRFTPADFELVASAGDGGDRDAIRFREDGRKPIPGTPLTVNYFPLQTVPGPSPLTDLNVGSVTRTLLETVARELALAHQLLDRIYDSAFLETAEGASLDKVVALVGATRLPAQRPVVTLRLSRASGATGRITVPAGTTATDADGSRYATLEAITFEPGESEREVLAAGRAASTPVVEAGALDRLEILIAGIAGVTNPKPAHLPGQPETDEQLRRRARGALHGVLHGTRQALEYGLLSMPEVSTVNVVEAPNGVAGEIRIEIGYADDSARARERVARRIEELRAAGIRVITGDAARLVLDLEISLTLTGASIAPDERAAVEAGIERRLSDHLAGLAPGSRIRRARLVSLVMADDRVVDAAVTLVAEGREPSDELTLDPDAIVELGDFKFAAPAFEEAGGPAAAVEAQVSILLPVHLVPGVTLAEATSAIRPAAESHVRGRGSEAPLTVDGLAAAIRDDSRFALVRADAVITVEVGGRFRQLTEGAGSYVPADNETLVIRTLEIEPREGGV